MPPGRRSGSHHSGGHRSSGHRSGSHHSSSHSSFGGGFGGSSRPGSFGGGSHPGGFGSPSGRNTIHRSQHRMRHRNHAGGSLLWWLFSNNNRNSGYPGNDTYPYGGYGESNTTYGTYENNGMPSGTQTVQNTVYAYKCEYCDCTVHYTNPEEISNICPNCGAPMEQLVNDPSAQPQTSQSVSSNPGDTYEVNDYEIRKRASRRSHKVVLIALGISLFTSIGGFLYGIVNGISNNNGYDASGSGSYVHMNGNEIQEMYVEELGRTCRWSKEYECYYDKQTDCYFVWEDRSEPACWQYWFEGVSSDFGDYGWMEYDETEECWYVEYAEGQWRKLPDAYYSDRLWHIAE